MRRSDDPKATQATRGRPFANGNPGRKPGSKNRATLVAAALLEGDAEELLRGARGGNRRDAQVLARSHPAAGAADQARPAVDGFCRRVSV